MIDTNELRESAIEWECFEKFSGKVVGELLDRLEAAEKERNDVTQRLVQAEIAKREIGEAHNAVTRRLSVLADENAAMRINLDDHRALVSDLRKEAEKLRARIAEMEQQEPVAIQHQVPSVDFRGECVGYSEWQDGKGLEHWPSRTLYALPGAQPAPSVPEGWIQRGMAELEAIRSRQDDDTLLDDRTLIERIGKAMLAAAPEAKP